MLSWPTLRSSFPGPDPIFTCTSPFQALWSVDVRRKREPPVIPELLRNRTPGGSVSSMLLVFSSSSDFHNTASANAQSTAIQQHYDFLAFQPLGLSLAQRTR